MKIKAIIFDVNETLLDMQKLENRINAEFENDLGFRFWFTKLLHYSLVENETEGHHDFSQVASSTFKMCANYFGKEYAEDQVESILNLVKELPAYPEVVDALNILKQDYILIALTNGNQEAVETQLEFAEIDEYFDAIYSVDGVGNFKPHQSTYHKVLRDYKIKAEESLMVAAHAWDIAGAKNAGLHTAFIARPGKSMYSLAKKPDYLFEDLKGLSEALLT